MKKHRTGHTLGVIDSIALGILLLTAFILRMYQFNAPLADFHSWRQADTAAVARNFAREGFNLMRPRYDDLSSIQSGLDNPEGLRFVEFPIYNAMFAGLHVVIPGLPIEVWGRIVSIVMSLVAIAGIYYIALREGGRVIALAAAFVYAVFPYFVFFSRTVLPETTAVGFIILSIAALYFGVHSDKRLAFFGSLAFSSVCYALAVLVKPTAGFYGIVLLAIFFRRYGLNIYKAVPAYMYFIGALLPFILWRVYISQFPEGIPASGWLITRVQTFEGERDIFFRPAFFRWMFFERLNNQILGGFSSMFLVLGALSRQRSILLHTFGISGLIYLLVFQGGNVQHEYYQIILFPAIAVLCGMGVDFLFRSRKLLMHPIIASAVLLGITGFSLFFSWYKVRDFYSIPYDLVQIASLVRTVTDPKDRVITDRLGDTTLLYLMDRKGSPAIYKDLDTMRQEGYDYLVVLNKDTIKNIKEQWGFDVVLETDKFTLFRL